MRFLAFFLLSAVAQTGHAQTLPAPLTDDDFAPVDVREARLGQLLFYDPILSGNREVACATCHHPDLGTADGVSLSIGDGGIGMGPDRRVDPDNVPEKRIPRNAPALFNLGAREFTVLFHDGRLEADASLPSGIRTPMGDDMAQGFASILSAQTMFPVLSRDEMAGSFAENDVARAVRQGLITGQGGAWDCCRAVSLICPLMRTNSRPFILISTAPTTSPSPIFPTPSLRLWSLSGAAIQRHSTPCLRAM